MRHSGVYAYAAEGGRGISTDITIPALPSERRSPGDSVADRTLAALHCSRDHQCSYLINTPLDLVGAHYQIFAVVRRSSNLANNNFIASNGNGTCTISAHPDSSGGFRDSATCTNGGGNVIHLGWSSDDTVVLGHRIDRNLATLGGLSPYRFSSSARPLSLIAATADSVLQLAVLEQDSNSFYTSEIPPRTGADFSVPADPADPADRGSLFIGGVFVPNSSTGHSALTWFDGDIVAILVYEILPMKGSPRDFDPTNALKVQDYLRNRFGPR